MPAAQTALRRLARVVERLTLTLTVLLPLVEASRQRLASPS